MTPQKAIILLRLRLNKLHSNDYDNIEDWIAVSVINKAQLEWVRKQIHGTNIQREGDEETTFKVDDLQVLLVEVPLKGSNKELYFESEKLPENYLWYKRILAKTTKGVCSGVVLDSHLVEEANVPTYLRDWSMQPSFDWGETFHTIMGDRIRIYTAGEFKIDDTSLLMYYRQPVKLDITGYKHEDGLDSTDSSLEFKDDVCELILDEAAAIIAGDVESINQVQLNKQRADINN